MAAKKTATKNVKSESASKPRARVSKPHARKLSENVPPAQTRGYADSQEYGSVNMDGPSARGEISEQIERLFQFAAQLDNDVQDLAETIAPILDTRVGFEVSDSDGPRPAMASSVGDQLYSVNERLGALSERLQGIRSLVAL